MNRTALYRALVEAGASEERAREAAESVVYGQEAATRSDIAEVNANLAAKLAEVNANNAVKFAEVNDNVARLREEVAAKLAEINADNAAKFAEVNADNAAKFAGVNADNTVKFAEVNDNVAGLRAEVAALEVRFERSLREFSVRITTLLVASQAMLFAALRLTGTA